MKKKSKQRQGIMDILNQKDFHPTVEEIYERMKINFPRIGIATVYRNIDQLLRNNMIVKIDVPGQPAHFDGEIDRHYHIRCTQCGKIRDLMIDFDLSSHIKLDALQPDFSISHYHIEFTGICAQCRGKVQKRNSPH